MAIINKSNIDEIKEIVINHVPADSSVLLKREKTAKSFRALVFVYNRQPETEIQVTDKDINIGLSFISMEILYDAFLQFDPYFAYILSDCIVLQDPSNTFYKVQKMVEPILSKYVDTIWKEAPLPPFVCYYTLCKIQGNLNSGTSFLNLLSQYILIRLRNQPNNEDVEKYNNDLIKTIVSCCNNYSGSQSDIYKIFDEESDRIFEKIVKNNKVDIFFENDYTLSNFIESVYLPLSKRLSAFLFNSGFSIQQIGGDGNLKKQGVLLSYYFRDSDNKLQARITLKSVLFRFISEIELCKIHFPVLQEPEYWSDPKYAILEQIKQKISSAFVYQNSINPLTDERNFALVLYYYISIGYLYYQDKKEFYRANQVVYEQLIANSGKYIPSAPLNCVSFFEIREKIESEYARSYQDMKEQLESDYKNLIQDKETEVKAEYKELIIALRNSVSEDSQDNGNRFGRNIHTKDSIFLALIQDLYGIGFIGNYYKALIPYIVKELYYDEI